MATSVVGKLVYLITGDTTALRSSMTKAQREVDRVAKKLQRAGEQMTKFVTLPILGIGTAFVKAASDAEETRAKFETAFRDVRDEAESTAEALAEGFGLSTTESERLLSSTGDLLKGFGATGQQALGLSNQVQQLAADLASYNNIQGGASRASEILTKAMLGEREALTSLGIKISEAEVQARLLENGQQDLEGRTLLLAKANATLELAFEQSGDAIGDFNRTQDSTANRARILKARFTDMAVVMGRDLLPVANQLLGWALNMVTHFNELEPSQRRMIIVLAGIAAAAGPVVAIGSKLVLTINSLSAAFKIGAPALGAYSLALAGIVAGIALLVRRMREAKKEQDFLDRAIEGTLKTTEEYNQALEILRERSTNITEAQADTAEELANSRRVAVAAKEALDLLSDGLRRGELAQFRYKATLAGIDQQFVDTAIQTDNLDLVQMRLTATVRQASGEVFNLSQVENAYASVQEREAKIKANLIALQEAEGEERRRLQAEMAAEIQALALLTKEVLSQNVATIDEIELIGDLASEFARFYDDTSRKRTEFYVRQLPLMNQQIFRINQEKDAFIAAGIERVEAERWAEAEIARIRQSFSEQERQSRLRNIQNQLSDIQQLASQLSAIFSQISANRQSQLDADYEREKENIENGTLNEEDKAAAIAELDEEFAQRRADIARDEAVRNKIFGIFDSIINTSVAFTKALPNLPLAIATAALGAVQTALIAAQPIPQAALGADFVTQGRQLLEVGDNPGGRERVSVTPLSSPNINGPGGTHVTVLLDKRTLLDVVQEATANGDVIIDARSVRGL